MMITIFHYGSFTHVKMNSTLWQFVQYLECEFHLVLYIYECATELQDASVYTVHSCANLFGLKLPNSSVSFLLHCRLQVRSAPIPIVLKTTSMCYVFFLLFFFFFFNLFLTAILYGVVHKICIYVQILISCTHPVRRQKTIIIFIIIFLCVEFVFDTEYLPWDRAESKWQSDKIFCGYLAGDTFLATHYVLLFFPTLQLHYCTLSFSLIDVK